MLPCIAFFDSKMGKCFGVFRILDGNGELSKLTVNQVRALKTKPFSVFGVDPNNIVSLDFVLLTTLIGAAQPLHIQRDRMLGHTVYPTTNEFRNFHKTLKKYQDKGLRVCQFVFKMHQVVTLCWIEDDDYR